jgi:O-antigen/teichoic acid export membrane protein
MRGATWTLIHVVVSLPVAFGANLLVARLLGVENYGRLAFLMTFMEVAGGIVSMGLGIGLLQFGSRAHAGGRAEEVRRLLSKSQGFRLLVVAPLLSVAVFLVADVSTSLLLAAVVFGIWMPAALDGAQFCITIEGRSDLGAKIAMVTNLVTQAAVVLAAWSTRSSDAVWVARLAVAGLMMLVYVAVASPAYRSAVLRPAFPRGFPPGFWRFAIPTGVAGIIGTLALTRTEVFFLTWLSTPEAVGVFALAFGLSNHIFAPAEAMVGPLIPAVSGLHEVDRGSLVAAFQRVLRASSVAIALACAGGLPALAILVPVLYGSEFAAAAPLLLALGAAGAVLTTGGPLSVFTMGRLSGRYLMLANTAALVTDLALALVLIPVWDAWGAVAAISSGALVRFGLLLGGEVRALAISTTTVLRQLVPALASIPITVLTYLMLSDLPGHAVVAALVAPVLALGVLAVTLKTSRSGLTEADAGALLRSVPSPVGRLAKPVLWDVTLRPGGTPA